MMGDRSCVWAIEISQRWMMGDWICAWAMANLIIKNIDDAIIKALEERAKRHGVSIEVEHYKILEKVLLSPPRKSFAEVLKG
jgi:predicted amino acid-binding ACT domain protein